MRSRGVLGGAALTLALVSACGGGGGDPAGPTPTAARRMTVSSPAFADGRTIPRRYTCAGENVSPPLTFSRIPAHTAGLALLVEDPDAPHGTYTHWLVWDIDPHTTHLDAGTAPPGAAEGRNSFTKKGYSGPCPPHGTPHHYVFTVYAADRHLGLGPRSTAGDVRHALTGHALAVGTLTGRFGL
ncbi:YbhB/YbcL family Raf kinase inhibitor-like protein [Streptomyces sp. NPDC020801]|uniref:YbhB/YbcL family Raf kinase inhibitor-like protein n=1 Tax=unclassified Streptomyces TaxID=2593676 RepID=UPI0037A66E99